MKLMKKLWGDSCFDHYFFWILVALELLMSFTFLGYLHIPPISITIAYLPILVAGCLYGPAQSVIIGLIFGAASLYKASASYVMPSDAVFSPFSSGAPVSSLLLSVGVRMLYGLAVGLAFRVAEKCRRRCLWIGVISFFAPKVHSLFVYTALQILFPELGYHFYSAFHLDWDDVIFAVICVIVVELLWAVYHSKAVQNIRLAIDQSVNNPYVSQKRNLFLGVFEFFVLLMAVLAAVYFSERESYMLERHGILVSEQISGDLLNLQMQFLVASLSLNLTLVVLLVCVYRYMAYKEYAGEMDELTGVMGRRLFFYYCGNAEKKESAGQRRTGWFLFVDVDYFKAVNDTFGHAVGDKVLKEIAANLHSVFGDDGKVGRIGGDEFAVIVEGHLSRQEMEGRLDRFLRVIAGTLSERKISCSIGAYRFAFPQKVDHLLARTDEILYKAKERGRACYVVETDDPAGP